MRITLTILILISFLINCVIGPVPIAQAQNYHLPVPGVIVHLSLPLDPPILKGIKIYLDNPFRFDFILDKGDHPLSNNQLKVESSKLIKYFLATLTIPEKDLWVNLSPYEKDRIIPKSFGLTEMGRDLLAEDYMLKQITASLIYPEDVIGKIFWKRVYEEAVKKFGTTNIPVNTFNKVWILPEKAIIYENAKAATAYVVESKLKVMLEQDYLSLAKHEGIQSLGSQIVRPNRNTTELSKKSQVSLLAKNILQAIVIPELSKEVNNDKNFATLRQIYNSLILATWYKKRIKDSILAQVFEDKNKIAGVNIVDPQEKQKIYERYLKAFKKGVYNYIKEEPDPVTQELVPRKYFSGGVNMENFSDLAMAIKPIRSASNLSKLMKGNPALVEIISQIQQEKPDSTTNRAIGISDRAMNIYGSKDTDSLNSQQWRDYLNPEDLIAAWKPIQGSPYGPFVKTKLMRSVSEVSLEIMPRYSDREKRSEEGIENLITSGTLDSHTAIILDSGGAHSIAMALVLMKRGYQPVIMFDATPTEEASSVEDLATLLYFSEEVKRLKKSGAFQKDSPPVFIMDAHRKYRYLQSDFPSAKVLNNSGISKVIYLTEANLQGKIKPHIKPLSSVIDMEHIMTRWEGKVERFDTGVSPNLSKVQTHLVSQPQEKHHDYGNRNLHVPGFYSDSPVEMEDVNIVALQTAGKRYVFYIPTRKFLVFNNGPLKSDVEGVNRFIDEILASPTISQEIKQKVLKRSTKAMLRASPSPAMSVLPNGGIDLTVANLNLQTRNPNGKIKFHIDAAMLTRLQNTSGFIPVIIDIQPLKSLPEFLGL